MSEIDVSNFCLVCYYDKETNKLARIEQYSNNSSDIQADIRSYEYGYNAKIIKPEQIIEQLQQLKAENEGLQSLNDFNIQKIETLEAENEELKEECDSLKKIGSYGILQEVKKNKQIENCLNDIEEICKNGCYINVDTIQDDILDLIKQTKGEE